jgi:hypothetical protein
VLELTFDEAQGTVSYRWKADETGFAMPVRAGARGHCQIVQPTAGWQTVKTPPRKDEFEVATERSTSALASVSPVRRFG